MNGKGEGGIVIRLFERAEGAFARLPVVRELPAFAVRGLFALLLVLVAYGVLSLAGMWAQGVRTAHADDGDAFTVAFHADDGGSALAAVQVGDGGTVPASSFPEDPEEDGYSFAGWRSGVSGVQRADDAGGLAGEAFTAGTVVSDDLDVYASFVANPGQGGSTGGQAPTWTVTFHGAAGPASVEVGDGGAVGASSVPPVAAPTYAPGATHVGWVDYDPVWPLSHDWADERNQALCEYAFLPASDAATAAVLSDGEWWPVFDCDGYTVDLATYNSSGCPGYACQTTVLVPVGLAVAESDLLRSWLEYGVQGYDRLLGFYDNIYEPTDDERYDQANRNGALGEEMAPTNAVSIDAPVTSDGCIIAVYNSFAERPRLRTVTFKESVGDVALTVPDGDSLSEYELPEAQAWRWDSPAYFIGWVESRSTPDVQWARDHRAWDGLTVDLDDPVTSDMRLFPVYAATYEGMPTPKAELHFYDAYGREVSTAEVDAGSAIPADVFPEPERFEGFEFAGWYDNDGGEGAGFEEYGLDYLWFFREGLADWDTPNLYGAGDGRTARRREYHFTPAYYGDGVTVTVGNSKGVSEGYPTYQGVSVYVPRSYVVGDNAWLMWDAHRGVQDGWELLGWYDGAYVPVAPDDPNAAYLTGTDWGGGLTQTTAVDVRGAAGGNALGAFMAVYQRFYPRTWPQQQGRAYGSTADGSPADPDPEPEPVPIAEPDPEPGPAPEPEPAPDPEPEPVPIAEPDPEPGPAPDEPEPAPDPEPDEPGEPASPDDPDEPEEPGEPDDEQGPGPAPEPEPGEPEQADERERLPQTGDLLGAGGVCLVVAAASAGGAALAAMRML